jgi:hypothetical protein
VSIFDEKGHIVKILTTHPYKKERENGRKRKKTRAFKRYIKIKF